jgi:CubicO group peptidase (beta-lactamase class C family)
MKFHLLFTVLFASGMSGFAQQAETLVLNKKTAHEIEKGGKQVYKLNSKANYFSLIIVDQDGVDLMIRTTDAAGKEIETFDSPNGTKGPEPVIIVSSTAATFNVEVMPLDDTQPKGNYTIELIRHEPKGSTPEKQIDQLMASQFRSDGPGASIAVSRDGKIVFSKGYGMANPEYNIANGPQTVFHIASISKQVTAFSIAMLADQGKISLDDDIRKYITELHDFGHKITIRQLVHHTSGLRDQWNLLAMAGWRLDDVITKDQVLRLLSHQKDLNGKPGDAFNYCNSGYTLMAEIVSRVSGKSFGDWTQENIFRPLGMNSTLFYEDHERIVKNRAYSFHDSPDGLKKSVLSYANAGATSLFTTAEDLLKWADNFKTMKVGNAKVMKQMEEKCILNNGDTLTYAFGQDIGKHKGLKALSHGGADAGYRSYLVRFPEQGYNFAVLSNYASANTGSIAYKIADIYLKDFLKSDEKKIEPVPAAAPAPVVSVSEDLLKIYSGQYQIEPGVIATFVVEDGKLIAKAGGQPYAMTPKSEKEFFIASLDASILFEKNNDNTVSQMVLKQGGRTVIAPRIVEYDLSKVDLPSFTGTFYSPELETRYTLTVRENKLIATHIRLGEIELTPSARDAFSGNAWYFGHVEFTRNGSGQVDGFKASSGRVRNVKFEKVSQ